MTINTSLEDGVKIIVLLLSVHTHTHCRKLKVESALLGAKATEQLESLKLELAKKAAQDLHSIAEELAAIHEQMDKVSEDAYKAAPCALI